MGGVSRFEDLLAWKRARALNRLIYEATFEGALARDFALSGQLRKSALSVMSNIVEGFARGSGREFKRFLRIALASCAELKSQLYAASDVGYLIEEDFESLMTRADSVSQIVYALWDSIDESD